MRKKIILYNCFFIVRPRTFQTTLVNAFVLYTEYTFVILKTNKKLLTTVKSLYKYVIWDYKANFDVFLGF